MLETRPDAIAHEATALADGIDFKHFAESFAQTNRLRTEGTDNLLAAAKEAGVERVVAQSFAGLTYARVGGPVKTEDDPLDDSLPEEVQQTVEAIKQLEAAVLRAEGIVLRYAAFYGAEIDPMRDAVRERKMPIVGDGGGVWSFVHVDDAGAGSRVERPRSGDPVAGRGRLVDQGDRLSAVRVGQHRQNTSQEDLSEARREPPLTGDCARPREIHRLIAPSPFWSN